MRLKDFLRRWEPGLRIERLEPAEYRCRSLAAQLLVDHRVDQRLKRLLIPNSEAGIFADRFNHPPHRRINRPEMLAGLPVEMVSFD
jgi:hypothetical protein